MTYLLRGPTGLPTEGALDLDRTDDGPGAEELLRPRAVPKRDRIEPGAGLRGRARDAVRHKELLQVLEHIRIGAVVVEQAQRLLLGRGFKPGHRSGNRRRGRLEIRRIDRLEHFRG